MTVRKLNNGTCNICEMKSVEGELSEYFGFICCDCISIINKLNAIDNVSFIRKEKK